MFALRGRSGLISDRCAAVFATIGVLYRNDSTKMIMDQKPSWNSAISKAKKIVDCSTSTLNLRWITKNEMVSIASRLKKFESSDHPFQKTVNLLYSGRNKIETDWRLIVLLISKAAGHPNVDDLVSDKKGVLISQKSLAEVTEMIVISHSIHKKMVNIQPRENSESLELNDVNFINKIALLSGDYLLANCFAEIAKLKNQEISELMSSSIRDLAEAEFIGRRDSQNKPLPSAPPVDRTNYAVKEWTLRNELNIGFLLGKSCKATLKLAKHNKEIQDQGYNFGKHLALARQTSLDLNPFISKDRNIPFNLCSAPVIFHIEHDPSILLEIDKGLESVSNVDYAKVYEAVINGPGIKLTKHLQREHVQRALEALNAFQDSDAKTALSNIIAAI